MIIRILSEIKIKLKSWSQLREVKKDFCFGDEIWFSYVQRRHVAASYTSNLPKAEIGARLGLARGESGVHDWRITEKWTHRVWKSRDKKSKKHTLPFHHLDKIR